MIRKSLCRRKGKYYWQVYCPNLKKTVEKGSKKSKRKRRCSSKKWKDKVIIWWFLPGSEDYIKEKTANGFKKVNWNKTLTRTGL